ncbi:MAG: NADH-quinone oxidoreductase subunit NuoK [Candidatus Marinimicrobia bacterium]|nr:NADH-quinone oxidoreductase subunit NuoK [Candidatus Neomarinimicrobiota bacterium]|tara:strand:+ start:1241 stop:1552 length:312 start_codon:yes stop_codon:yes gene_type:complete
MAESLHIYLFISSILLSLGIFAVITRTNAVAILMGIELILNSANINFIAFNRFGDFKILDGHVFSVFVIVLAAAEAAVALAIIINLFKNTGTVKVDEAKELKG